MPALPITLDITEQKKRVSELASAVRTRGLWERLSKAALLPAEDEHDLLRLFLSMRDYDVDAALAMLLQHLDLRASLKLDTLANMSLGEVSGCDERVMNYWFPHWHDCVDRHGRPVGWAKLGAFEFVAVSKQVPPERLTLFHMWQRECMCRRLRKASAVSNEKFDWFTLIIDMKHWRTGLMSRAALAFAEELMALDTELFSQRVGVVYIINAPYLFSACWAVLSPFMSKRTLDKMQLFSSESAWRPVLLKAIDKSELPVEYGGVNPVPLRDLGKPAPVPEALALDVVNQDAEKGSGANKSAGCLHVCGGHHRQIM